MNKRRNFKPEQKAKIIIEVLREEKTLTEMATEYEVHPNQLSRWKTGVPSQGSFIPTSGRLVKVKGQSLAA